MTISIIVEGKNDRARLKRLLHPEVHIHCTYGTPSNETLDQLRRTCFHDEVYLFMDNDPAGKKIRSLLRDIFSDAVHMYTRKGYAGVEGTPDEYLLTQLEKAGLDEYIMYP
ncbi:toprim domain-containing protein [Paenibacillus sp. N1-5-1-14]|uniref:toprim domain-containing protein n=1 Tax=Paenibacillus radicibacter TaxID=2972488 RepID=UPI0021597A8A|nr:toprim domain-containing protein [Paenibacillus radicibacter]MCR8645305.1 toprim domain-containing protein [Paenibacillus radicibacter]